MYVEYGPIKLVITADDKGITHIDYVKEQPMEENNESIQAKAHLTLAKNELQAYFSNQLVSFTVPIHLTTGTAFQQKVWHALQEIPYGTVVSYQDVAKMIDSPKAQQAVGQANKRNPLPIIIPCHRVIGKNNQLVGYSGSRDEGLVIKQFLLDIENKQKRV